MALMCLRFIFRWLAIPWLQAEADEWANLKNSTQRRANKKKILPHGPPALIIERPDEYDTIDFKVYLFRLLCAL